jgi:cell division protein ZapE
VRHVFDQLSVTKQRYHFDTFCGQLHHMLLTKTIDQIAHDIHHQYRVIWIDELQIYDIATAMLLRKLIPALVEHHVIILMTGNIKPDDFYKAGLNYDQFADFIPYFINHFHCFSLDGGIDYRLLPKKSNSDHSPHRSQHFWLSSPESDTEMNAVFQSLAPQLNPIPQPTSFELQLNQRTWLLHKTLGPAVFIDFQTLAFDDRAFDDYRTLVQTFPVVFLTDVPIFDHTNRDACRRFMAFIDILYDGGAELYLSAATLPADLYQDKSARLPFARTASRLAEIIYS